MTKQIRDYVLEARQIREAKEQKNEDPIMNDLIKALKQEKLDIQRGEGWIDFNQLLTDLKISYDIDEIDVPKSIIKQKAKQILGSMLKESTQKNEANDDYAKRFNAVRDKLIAKIKNMSQASNARDIQNLSIAATTCLNNLFLARSEFSNGYSEDLDNYLNLALKAVQ